jgi:hypothetical protein
LAVQQYSASWWSIADSSKAAESALNHAKSLHKQQSWRLSRALWNLGIYLGRQVASLDSVRGIGYQSLGELHNYAASQLTPARSVVDTAVAKIAAKQRPVPRVRTSGADYRTRVQAKKLSKFLQGQFSQSQGVSPTIWDLTLQSFWDCSVWEFGAVRVRANVEAERVDVERVFPWELYYDPLDSERGRPTLLYHGTRYDRTSLCQLFPDSESAINDAPSYSDPGSMPHVNTQVRVWECWHLGVDSDDADGRGRYLAVLDAGHGPIVLCDEPYEHLSFPFAFIQWQPAPFGCSGLTLIEQCELPQSELNYVVERCRENIRLTSGGWLVAQEDTVDRAALEANDGLKIIEVRSSATLLPNVVMPDAFSPSTWQYMERMLGFAYQQPGVSELSAQGRREPGIESGIAMRNMDELQGERFLPHARRYEQFHTDIGKRMLEAVQDLAERGVSPTSFLPSEGLIETIDWTAIRPAKEDVYDVEIQPAASGSDSVGSTLQFVEDMRAAGYITPEAASRLITSGNPDVESETSRMNAQYNWIERVICEIHDETDPDADIVVDRPDPLMLLPAAAKQMRDAYLECSSWPNTPENKRRCMRNWVTDCFELINRGTQTAQDPPLSGMQPGPPAPQGVPPMS